MITIKIKLDDDGYIQGATWQDSFEDICIEDVATANELFYDWMKKKLKEKHDIEGIFDVIEF